MATQDTVHSPTVPGVDFQVERFEWTAGDRLEVVGRWFGVRGRRFVRPVLNVQLPDGRRRLIALLEHKPWAPDEGNPWIAAFAWNGAPEGVKAAELEVGPSLVVDLPLPRAGGPVVRQEPPEARLPVPGEEAHMTALRAPVPRLRAEAPAPDEVAVLHGQLARARETIESLRSELSRAQAPILPPASLEPPGAADASAAPAEQGDVPPYLRTASEQLAAVVAERDALAAELHATRDERDRVAAHLERVGEAAARTEALRAEQRDTAARLEVLRAERDDVAAQLQQAAAQRDDVAAQLRRVRAERGDAAAQLRRAAAQRDAVAAQLEASRAKHDDVTVQLKAAHAERDDGAAQLRAAREARDSAVAQLEAARAERDDVAAQVAAARAERDDALGRATEAEASRDALALERDEALSARDQAATERDAALAERQAAVRARDNARQRAARAAAAGPAADGERDAAPRPAAPPALIRGPAEPLVRRRSPRAAWALRLVTLLVLAAVVVALLLLLRGVL